MHIEVVLALSPIALLWIYPSAFIMRLGESSSNVGTDPGKQALDDGDRQRAPLNLRPLTSAALLNLRPLTSAALLDLRHIHEARVMSLESNGHRCSGAITVLGHDEVSLAGPR